MAANVDSSVALREEGSCKPEEIVDGRFRLIRQIGVGGVGEVFEAVDTQNDSRVALKLLRASLVDEEKRALNFQFEYHRLAGLDHPNILSVFDYGVWQRRPYFTMELVEGRDLDQVPIEERTDDLMSILIQLTDALAYIHGRNFVHRDIKAQNIRIVRNGSTRVKLMDFGLMMPAGLHLGGQIAGTLAYMAPEAAAGQRIDHRADLYSLGVLISYMLLGRYPRAVSFHQDRPRIDVEAALPPLPEGVCDELEELVHELLNPLPIGRPAKTFDVLRRLARIAGEGTISVTATAPPTLESLDLIGRQKERQTVLEYLENTPANEGCSATITGPAGVGKTRLIEDLVLRCKSSGSSTVCVWAKRGARLPYRVLSELLTPMFHELDKDGQSYVSKLPPILRNLFRDKIETSQEDTDYQPHSDPVQERYRIFQALDAMEPYLGSKMARTVFFIDDIEASDDASSQLIELLRSSTGRLPFKLVFTLDSSVLTQTTKSLEALFANTEVVKLRGLVEAEIDELLRAVFGDVHITAAFVPWLNRLTGGIPRQITEMLEHLTSKGLISRREGMWYFPMEGWEHESAPAVEPMIARRLNELDDDSRLIMSVLAVFAETTLDAAELRQLTDLEHERLAATLAELVSQALIVSERGQFRIHDRRVADRCYDDISYERRCQLHDAAGSLLESRKTGADQRARLLGYHYARGQKPANATPFLLEAGRLAYAKRAFADAVEPLTRAEEILASQSDSDPAMLTEMWQLLGRIGFMCDIELSQSHFEKLYNKLNSSATIRFIRWLSRGMPKILAVMAVLLVSSLGKLLKFQRPRLSQLTKPIEEFCTACTFLANIESTHGRTRSALAYVDGIRPFAFSRKLIPWATKHASSGVALVCQGRFGELDILEQAREVYHNDKDTPIAPWDRTLGKFVCDFALGMRAVLSGVGNYEEACHRLEKVAEQNDSDFVRAGIHQIRAGAAALEGRLSETFVEQERFSSYHESAGFLWQYVNLHLIFSAIAHYQSGLLEKAKLVIDDLARSGHGEFFRDGWAIFHQGTVLGIEGKPNEAIIMLKKALGVAQYREHQSAHMISLCYLELARQYGSLADYRHAEGYLRRALKIVEDPDTINLYLRGHCKCLAGELRVGMGDLRNARRFYNEALGLADALNNPLLMGMANMGLHRVCLAEGDDSHTPHLRVAQNIFESLGNARYIKEIARLVKASKPPSDTSGLTDFEDTLVSRPDSLSGEN